jgi:phosphoribosylglycinamide formyltransferase-1
VSEGSGAAAVHGPARLGILLSGRGSNFLALHAAIARGELPATIAVVVSNLADAPGLARAGALGLATACVPAAAFASRAEQEEAILAALAGHRADWVCLAGFMRLLSPRFVGAYPQRVLNIHPSLLPAFPGLHAQRQALAHGVRISGCTVHFVDDGLDSGPIVAQRAVPVRDDDDEASLSARILEQEHVAYPEALRRLITEPWRVEGRRVRFGAGADQGGGRDDDAAPGGATTPAQASRG